MAQARRQEIDEKLAQLRREGEEREAHRIADSSGIPYIDLASTPIELDAIRLIDEDEARAAHVAAIEKRQKEIAVAALNPSEEATRAVIDRLTKQGFAVRLFVASASGLQHAWQLYERLPKKQERITDEVVLSEEVVAKLEGELKTIDIVKEKLQSLDVQAATVSDALMFMFAGAISLRASDIHFEPTAEGVRLRYRIDGILLDVVPAFPRELFSLLLSRIKLLSGLKLNVADEPQDGRFTIVYGARGIDLRVSVIPSEYGETVVLRILDAEQITSLGLEDLGLRPDDLERIEEELRKPQGMILTTGPTGSGKTTTLYAFLRHTQSSETKTITIEDPIEYHIEGIEQTQVNADSGYTFAAGLRSIMRQDPDIILVGEIRDGETAGIAIQSALTGHLVFSTVHANDAIGGIARLTDLGVQRQSIASAVTLIIAQRLVRRLCPSCRVPQQIDEQTRSAIERFLSQLPQQIDRSAYAHVTLYTVNAKGCAECQQRGYRGRIGIYELLRATEEVQDLIINGASERELFAYVREHQGMLRTQEDGILRALSGITTLEEVERVTGPIQWPDG